MVQAFEQYEQATGEAASRARVIMEEKLARGRESAKGAFEHVNANLPSDVIAKATALRFTGGFPGSEEDIGASAVKVQFGSGSTVGIHGHALGQLAERAGIPSAYLRSLSEGKPWQRELAAHALNQHYHLGEGSGSRFLCRTVKQELRGFLSDKFRRLDSRPLLEAFAESCEKVGAVPVEGTATDVRVAVKALLPIVFEPIPGEALCLGVEWANSDFGAGKHAVRAFILRLWCLNGATTEDVLSQVHLGGKLDENIEFSQRTYDFDTKTSVSALKDVVVHKLGATQANLLLAGIKRANENQVEWRGFSQSAAAKKLLKGELQAARDAFESNDVINLPAGKSLWRASNAISWLAGKAEDGDRKLELQRIAGEVIGKAA